MNDDEEFQDETDLLPTEEECDRRHEYREFYRNHLEDGESIDDGEPDVFFRWTAVPYTDPSRFEQGFRERNPKRIG